MTAMKILQCGDKIHTRLQAQQADVSRAYNKISISTDVCVQEHAVLIISQFNFIYIAALF